MAKATVSTIANLQNESTAVSTINANFAALVAAIEKQLSRDGTAPNGMTAVLDMNNYRIINLPAPSNANDAARHGDLQGYVDAAEAAQDAAEASETAVTALHLDFVARYIGAESSDPSLDPLDNPVVEGAIYYNTVEDELRVWAVRPVLADEDQVLVGSDEVRVDKWDPVPSQTIANLLDVALNTLANGHVLRYNSGTGKWQNILLTAANVPWSGSLDATDVDAALDEIVAGTLLGQFIINFYAQGLLEGGEQIFRLGATQTFTVDTDTSAFVADCSNAPVSEVVLSLRKNGVQFGTITFAGAATTGVWSIPGETTFNADDIFSVYAPADADTAMRDLVISLVATRA